VVLVLLQALPQPARILHTVLCALWVGGGAEAKGPAPVRGTAAVLEIQLGDGAHVLNPLWQVGSLNCERNIVDGEVVVPRAAAFAAAAGDSVGAAYGDNLVVAAGVGGY
jgi:hypothetical protein